MAQEGGHRYSDQVSIGRFALQRRNKSRAHRLLHERIVPERVEGLKRATAVCVGEKHSLALQVSFGCILPFMVALRPAGAHPVSALRHVSCSVQVCSSTANERQLQCFLITPLLSRMIDQRSDSACSLQSWWCAPAQQRGLSAPTAAVASLSTRGSLASALDVDDEDEILLHELVRSDSLVLAHRLHVVSCILSIFVSRDGAGM